MSDLGIANVLLGSLRYGWRWTHKFQGGLNTVTVNLEVPCSREDMLDSVFFQIYGSGEKIRPAGGDHRLTVPFCDNSSRES